MTRIRHFRHSYAPLLFGSALLLLLMDAVTLLLRVLGLPKATALYMALLLVVVFLAVLFRRHPSQVEADECVEPTEPAHAGSESIEQ